MLEIPDLKLSGSGGNQQLSLTVPIRPLDVIQQLEAPFRFQRVEDAQTVHRLVHAKVAGGPAQTLQAQHTSPSRLPLLQPGAAALVPNVLGIAEPAAYRSASTTPPHPHDSDCIYDQSGGVDVLVVALSVPTGGRCGDRDCWTSPLSKLRGQVKAALCRLAFEDGAPIGVRRKRAALPPASPRRIQSAAFARRTSHQADSTIMATPWPPPMQSVAKPRLAWRRCIS